MACTVPSRGHGVGRRTQLLPRVWEGTARVDWFEAVSENFMIRGGRPLAVLEKAREIAPLVLHGVSLSLGSTDPLNDAYLHDLQTLIHRFEPAWVSDHLCWGSVGGHYAHDLLPLPYTEEALTHVVERVRAVPGGAPCDRPGPASGAASTCTGGMDRFPSLRYCSAKPDAPARSNAKYVAASMLNLRELQSRFFRAIARVPGGGEREGFDSTL